MRLRPIIIAAIVSCLSGCSSVASLFGDGNATLSQPRDKGPCLNVSPENQLHPLAVCETSEFYTVRVLERTWSFAKRPWRAQLREQVRRLADLQPRDYPLDAQTSLDIWLAAPAFRPDLAYWVAVLQSTRAPLAVVLAIDPESWDLQPSSRTILPQNSDGYKKKVFSFGLQADQDDGPGDLEEGRVVSRHLQP